MPGLFDQIGSGVKGLLSGLRDPNTQYALAAARAFADGDYGGGSRIQAAGHEYGLAKQKQETALRRQQELMEAARQVIQDPAEWAEFQADPEEWAKVRLGRRHGFQSIAEGNTGFWGDPGMDGSTQRTAPKIMEVGPDVVLADPQGLFGGIVPSDASQQTPAPAPDDMSARMREVWDSISGMEAPAPAQTQPEAPMARTIFKGKADMERYAEQFGPPGSEAYLKALQDFRLSSFGPTAYGYRDKLQDDALAQSNTNNQRNNDTSRGNNERNNATSRDNNIRTTTTSRENNQETNATRLRLKGKLVGGKPVSQNEPMARSSNGTIMVVRNGQWVDTGQR